MSRLLFTHSYFYRFDPKQWRAHQPYPPLATIQAAALLRNTGHQVALFDTNLREHPEEIVDHIKSFNPHYLVIYDDGFNYLTKMCLTNMREAACRMAKIASEAGCTVIVNSSDSTDRYDYYLDRGVDYVVLGEGEATLRALIDALDSGIPAHTIAGIAFREKGTTIKTPPRAVMHQLDELPMPGWDLVDIDSYRKIWLKYHGYFSLNIATTRGCPFKCNWCAKPIYGNRYHSRSPEHVVREINFLIEQYHPSHFWMCDDIFALKPGWIQQFQKLVEQNRLQFRYKIQSRADLLLEEDTIEALARSGVDTVWMGAESGSQKILDAMDKGTTVEQISEATRLLHRHGIRVGLFLQFGYLGETREDIQKTIDLVLQLMPDEIGISVSYPLPGTKFYEKVRDQLTEKQNWSDSDDLALMYQGTYSPNLYRVLHRYVHNRYAIEKGKHSFRRIFHARSIRQIAALTVHIPLAVVRKYKLDHLYRRHVK